MDIKEIDSLIRFHRDGLQQYGQFMSPSALHLEEKTIKALEALKALVEIGGK